MKRKCSRPCIAKMNFIKHFIIVTPFLKSLHEKKKEIIINMEITKITDLNTRY